MSENSIVGLDPHQVFSIVQNPEEAGSYISEQMNTSVAHALYKGCHKKVWFRFMVGLPTSKKNPSWVSCLDAWDFSDFDVVKFTTKSSHPTL